jgi:hypothetical protein
MKLSALTVMACALLAPTAVLSSKEGMYLGSVRLSFKPFIHQLTPKNKTFPLQHDNIKNPSLVARLSS